MYSIITSRHDDHAFRLNFNDNIPHIFFIPITIILLQNSYTYPESEWSRNPHICSHLMKMEQIMNASMNIFCQDLALRNKEKLIGDLITLW